MQQVDLIDVDGIAMTDVGHDDCQAHGNLAAATAMTKKTTIWPVNWPNCNARAISDRLTALSIISTHMKMISALRRTSTPSAPMTKMMAERIR